MKKTIKAFFTKVEQAFTKSVPIRRFYREESVPARAVGLSEHALRHLVDSIALYKLAALRAVRSPYTREQEAEEIVELR